MIRAGSSWCDLVKHADGRVEFVSLTGTTVVCEDANTGARRWAVNAGRPLLYLRAAADVEGRVCAIGQGHDDGGAWLVFDDGRVEYLGVTHGVFPVLISGRADGWSAFIQRKAASFDQVMIYAGGLRTYADAAMPPTSQGFLYVDGAGTPITQDAGRHTIPGLALPSPATGGVWVGQSASAATIALYDQGRITPLGTPGGQPPHIVESGGLYYVCSYVEGGAWLSTHRKPFAAVTPPVEPPKDTPMNPPGVTVDHFDPVIRAGQPWKVEFHDRNNPGFSGAVEIVNNSVHVRFTNPVDTDRSSARRPVEIKGPSA